MEYQTLIGDACTPGAIASQKMAQIKAAEEVLNKVRNKIQNKVELTEEDCVNADWALTLADVNEYEDILQTVKEGLDNIK